MLLTGSVRKDLDRLRGSTRTRLRDALLELMEVCRQPGGGNTNRIRIGDYRAAHNVDDDAEAVMVLRVRHRRDVYRGL